MGLRICLFFYDFNLVQYVFVVLFLFSFLLFLTVSAQNHITETGEELFKLNEWVKERINRHFILLRPAMAYGEKQL